MQIVVDPEDLHVKVCLRIKKPVNEVFAAVQQPELMSQYFISTSTGPMVTGSKLTWTFADMGAVKEVTVIDAVTNEKLEFSWNAAGGITRVVMTFVAVTEDTTLLKIRENCGCSEDGGADASSVKRVKGQTYGWTHFMFCLKGFLELGVNLRAGSVEPADFA
jgi:uncharacterized protein YndB with AHSA1/START domain